MKASQLTSHVPYAKRRRNFKVKHTKKRTFQIFRETVVLEQEFVVSNKLGIHARVAAQIVKVANQYQSEIWISKSGNKVNGKSILDILTLVCPHGSKVSVVVSGPDASEALNALGALFRTKFGES